MLVVYPIERIIDKDQTRKNDCHELNMCKSWAVGSLVPQGCKVTNLESQRFHFSPEEQTLNRNTAHLPMNGAILGPMQ